MKNKLLISKDIYDFYTIPISLGVLFKNQRNSYLITELGKRHPCFSDEYCFDSQLKIKKKQIFENVVVINKFKLSELRANNPGKVISLEETGKSVFRLTKLKLLNNPLLVLAAGVLVSLSIGVVCLGRSIKSKTAETKMQQSAVVENTITEIRTNTNFLEDIFAVVESRKGTIISFDYRNEFPYEMFAICFNGIFPEDFIALGNRASFSEVSYKNGIPVMEMIYRNRLAESSVQREISSIAKNPVVREFLQKNQCEIFGEDNGRFRFYFCGNAQLLFSGLADLLNQENVNVAGIRMGLSGSDKYEIELRLTEMESNFDMSLFAQNIKFFKGLTEKNAPASYAKEKATVYWGEKIGEVSYLDGSKLVFYKTPEGKTIKRKE